MFYNTGMRAAGALLLGLCAACYAPSPQPGAPCIDGACPTGLICAAATQTCELSESAVDAAIDDAAIDDDDASVIVDAAVAPPDAPPDAQTCFGGGLVSLCLAAAPASPLTITANTTIDTDTSPLCVEYSGDTGETALCVVAATTVSIDDNRRLRANGSKPLVVIASESLVVDGTIDVARGAGANPPTCVPPTTATNADGGAGGSFQGRGGRGGDAVSGTGPSAALGTTTAVFRGGCRGGNGAGGDGGLGGSGGGALYLIAPTITINGTLDASGGGGGFGANESGGGGGGAGGFIGLDAPSVTVASTARVIANGGGGGEGGTPNKDGNSGSPGGGLSAAPGGSGGAPHGGNGGDGSANATLGGQDGRSGGTCDRSDSAGGGGGGGAGFVYVFPAQTLGGSISPPVSPL